MAAANNRLYERQLEEPLAIEKMVKRTNPSVFHFSVRCSENMAGEATFQMSGTIDFVN